MRNKDEFKALIEERAEAQRRAAALLAQRRKIAIRSAAILVLGLAILPIGARLLTSPWGEMAPDAATREEVSPEDGLLDQVPSMDENPTPGETGPEIVIPDAPVLEGEDTDSPQKPGFTETPVDPDKPDLPPPYSDDQSNLESSAPESITDPIAGITAINRLVGLKAEAVDDRKVDEAFRKAYLDFAVKLFQDSDAIKKGENLLFSPLSAMLALSMTANGADGQTLAEMEAFLGGDLSVDELNATLRTWMTAMTNRKFSDSVLNAANSIWVREKMFNVSSAFLQTNANYYVADFYEAPFDDSTADDINLWIKYHTNGMIEKMVGEIDDRTMMYLINTLYLETVWQDTYSDKQLADGIFHGTNGDVIATMMSSQEDTYLSMEGAVGFQKRLDGYTFTAILPNEGIDVSKFIASLSAEELLAFLQSGTDAEVHAKIPSFSYDSSIALTDVLKPYLPSAMNPLWADFSNMGETIFGDTLFIGNVRQNTSITLGTNGVCAAAGTIIDLPGSAEPPGTPSPVYHITLDRPFVYLITDSTTGLPIFIGMVEQV